MLELAGIIILGILAQWIAWRFKLPAILPLILIGLLVGPVAATYLSEDGSKWIEPVWNGTKGLFPGEGLYYFVSLAISVILFEGGLTLKLKEINNVGGVITKLISVGSIVTFFGAAVAVYYLFNLDWRLCFLFSALIIVTGPTVIAPILRNVPLKKDVSAVLKWEGILIDPIGALVAVLVFDFIFIGGDGGFTQTALVEFLKIVLFGFTFGFTFAYAIHYIITKKWIPHYLMNVFVLAAVLGVFVLSDSFAHESGLLSVVVMGMVLGNKEDSYIDEVLYFKESLSIILISVLFILLAANIDMDNLMIIMNWQMLILFAVVVLVIRPIGVFLSTINSSLKLNEKLFISWVGPRGIVAAGIASLFGSKLMAAKVPGAEYITPLVFAIVLGTVLLNATTARLFAKIVGVFVKESNGILIVGASKIARLIAKYLQDNDRTVFLMDSNVSNIEKAKALNLQGIQANIYSETIVDDIELSNVGYLMSLTANTEINKFAIDSFGNQFGENGSFRLVSKEEMADNENNPTEGLFSHTDDYNSLSAVAETYPEIQEIAFKSKNEYSSLIKKMNTDVDRIPLFVRENNNDIHIISSFNEETAEGVNAGYIAFLGAPFDV